MGMLVDARPSEVRSREAQSHIYTDDGVEKYRAGTYFLPPHPHPCRQLCPLWCTSSLAGITPQRRAPSKIALHAAVMWQFAEFDSSFWGSEKAHEGTSGSGRGRGVSQGVGIRTHPVSHRLLLSISSPSPLFLMLALIRHLQPFQ